MVTELTPAEAPPATSQPPRHPTPWQVTNCQFETLHRGLVRQAIFPLRRSDYQKLEERVATLIQRKPSPPRPAQIVTAQPERMGESRMCEAASCTN